MATTTKKKKPVDTEEVAKRIQQPRISITVDTSTRRNMRIAAAHADLEVGDWARKVLTVAAAKATGQDPEDLEEE